MGALMEEELSCKILFYPKKVEMGLIISAPKRQQGGGRTSGGGGKAKKSRSLMERYGKIVQGTILREMRLGGTGFT